MNKRYYKVKCKCGHVGRHHYIAVDFAIIATNGKEAAQIARAIPRCKHDHKDCILEVSEISYDEFLIINKNNNNDPYLRCRNVQEQRAIDLSDRLVSEHIEDTIYLKEESIHSVFQGKTKIRHPKKIIKFYSLNTYSISF